MKLTWLGHACFSMTFADGTTLVTDPFDPPTGYPIPNVRADIVTMSHHHHDHDYMPAVQGSPVTVDTAGTRTVGGVKLTGIPSCHDEVGGAKRGPNMIYRIEADGLTIVHLGDLGHILTEEQASAVRGADAVLIPIGGFYTIDTKQAIEVLAQIKPRLAIGMHFSNKWCRFPIQDASEFLSLTGGKEVANGLELPNDRLSGCVVIRYE